MTRFLRGNQRKIDREAPRTAVARDAILRDPRRPVASTSTAGRLYQGGSYVLDKGLLEKLVRVKG